MTTANVSISAPVGASASSLRTAARLGLEAGEMFMAAVRVSRALECHAAPHPADLRQLGISGELPLPV